MSTENHVGRRVYECRLQGGLWTEAAAGARLGIQEAVDAARMHAEKEGLPWPPDRRTMGRTATADLDIQDLRRCVRETFKVRD